MGMVFLFALWSQHIGIRTKSRRLGTRCLISLSVILLLASSIVGEAVLIALGVNEVNAAALREGRGKTKGSTE